MAKRGFRVVPPKNFRNKNTRPMTRAELKRFKAMGNANKIARSSKPRRGVVVAVSADIPALSIWNGGSEPEEEL